MSKRDLPQSFFAPPVARGPVRNVEGALTGKFVHEMPRGGVSKSKRGPRKQSKSRSKSAQASSSSRSFKPIGGGGSSSSSSSSDTASSARAAGGKEQKQKVRSASANSARGRSPAAANAKMAPPRTPSRENKRGSPSIGVGMIPLKPKKHRPQPKHGAAPQIFTSTSLDKKLSTWFPDEEDGEHDGEKTALQAEMAGISGNGFESSYSHHVNNVGTHHSHHHSHHHHSGGSGSSDGRGSANHGPPHLAMPQSLPRGGFAVGGHGHDSGFGSINFTIGNVTTPSWRDPIPSTPDSQSSSAYDDLVSPAFDVQSNELDSLQTMYYHGDSHSGGRRGSDGSGTGSSRWRPDSCPELSTAIGGLRTYTPAIPEQIEPQHLQQPQPQRSMSAGMVGQQHGHHHHEQQHHHHPYHHEQQQQHHHLHQQQQHHHHQGHHHQQQHHSGSGGGHHVQHKLTTPAHLESPHQSPLTHIDAPHQHGGGAGGGHGPSSPPAMMGTLNEYDEFLSPQPVTFDASVPNQHSVHNPWQMHAAEDEQPSYLA